MEKYLTIFDMYKETYFIIALSDINKAKADIELGNPTTLKITNLSTSEVLEHEIRNMRVLRSYIAFHNEEDACTLEMCKEIMASKKELWQDMKDDPSSYM